MHQRTGTFLPSNFFGKKGKGEPDDQNRKKDTTLKKFKTDTTSTNPAPANAAPGTATSGNATPGNAISTRIQNVFADT